MAREPPPSVPEAAGAALDIAALAGPPVPTHAAAGRGAVAVAAAAVGAQRVLACVASKPGLAHAVPVDAGAVQGAASVARAQRAVGAVPAARADAHAVHAAVAVAGAAVRAWQLGHVAPPAHPPSVAQTRAASAHAVAGAAVSGAGALLTGRASPAAVARARATHTQAVVPAEHGWPLTGGASSDHVGVSHHCVGPAGANRAVGAEPASVAVAGGCGHVASPTFDAETALARLAAVWAVVELAGSTSPPMVAHARAPLASPVAAAHDPTDLGAAVVSGLDGASRSLARGASVPVPAFAHASAAAAVAGALWV